MDSLVRLYFSARSGAPPVRGKGAGSHPTSFAQLWTFHSGPELSGTWATTEGRFMPRKLTSATTLDNLRKEAKRWFKALCEGDAEARQRFERAYPKATGNPVLRDVQHALAREYGLENWKDLKLAAEQASDKGARTLDAHVELADRFLEHACPDHHVRGTGAHRMARHAAMRLLEQNPAIVREDLYTAIVCGEIEEVERILRERPQLANVKRPASGRDRSGAGASYDFLRGFGGKEWEPLLYLCFTRLPLAKANENA